MDNQIKNDQDIGKWSNDYYTRGPKDNNKKQCRVCGEWEEKDLMIETQEGFFCNDVCAEDWEEFREDMRDEDEKTRGKE